MRLALTNRSLIAAIVLIAVTAAAFAVACTDGVHTPGGSIGDVCATMTHSSALEAVANANSTPLAHFRVGGRLRRVRRVTPRPPRVASGRRLRGRARALSSPLNGRLRL